MNKIKELRKEYGWTQTQLGQKLSVKSAAISKYENGHITLTAETISMLCDLFNVSADYIIGRTESKSFCVNQSVSKNFQDLIDSYSDLNEDEIKKVKEYIEFLKSKRND